MIPNSERPALPTSEPASEQLVSFVVAGLLFGITLADAREVLSPLPVTPVPLAAPLSGLMNLRGEIVPVVDLRELLGLERRKPESAAINLVVGHGAEVMGLVIDEVGEVVEVNAAGADSPPDDWEHRLRRIIRAIYPFKDGSLLVLDPGRTLSAITEAIAGQGERSEQERSE